MGKIELMGCAGPPGHQYYLLLITVVHVYCCAQKMVKKLKMKKQGFFVKFLSLATPMILRQDRALKFFHKKTTFNAKFFFSKTWRIRVKSLDSFLKPPRIAWHYYDVDTWSSLLLLTFVRVNPKLKKLQFQTRTTYWLCSHYCIFIIGSTLGS